MRVIIVEPLKPARVEEIEAGLESLQHIVGGYIEAVYPWEDTAAIVCNEEAKLENLSLNRALRDNHGKIYDIISGTFLVVGLGEEDFDSLTDAQVETYMTRFQQPEEFLCIGKHIVAVPV